MSEEPEFSNETIEYVSKLALLDLSEEEKEKLSKQLNNILSYFKKLEDLDTVDVEPTRHPIEGLNNVFREDEPWEGLTQEEALKNAEHKKEGYFKAPRILKD
ncbi:MAG: Aspartyl/glutamyl-tRNA(Asn/Gln) amidotransferase subunit C [Promethearchaeota archaeon]|jgi:aspartyl-tRNA(Asn)/glutamyl-tRNA(Gln) amidotransferase subunit C|nr:MAG: Aspartyl/glutamyl-tRNA(Asn/Gln) amidotransferase subunit C [Candidatus Lokiarchaeota archaeon]